MSVLFWEGLVRELIRQRAPLDAVFAYRSGTRRSSGPLGLRQPLSGGRVTTANGQSYDMASNIDRTRMIDDGFSTTSTRSARRSSGSN